MHRNEAVDQLKSVWTVLSADLDCAVAYGQEDNSPYAQRALVRTFFAAVEGLSFQLRQVTIASLEGTDFLSTAELTLLREERFTLDRKGRPKISTAYLPFPESLLFSLSTYAKIHGASFEVDRVDSGWQAFLVAAELRDRVTHPKDASSLTPSNAQLQALMDASRWWQATLLSLFRVCGEADAYWFKKLGASN
jgi:hypothetical protein